MFDPIFTSPPLWEIKSAPPQPERDSGSTVNVSTPSPVHEQLVKRTLLRVIRPSPLIVAERAPAKEEEEQEEKVMGEEREEE